MKVLVTGGAGFLGRHIVLRLLEREDDVRIYQRSDAPELKAQGVSVVRGDITDFEHLQLAVKGCDAVIHTAAKSGVWGDRKSYFDCNVKGTENVIRSCQKHGIRYLVHTSTPSVCHRWESVEGGDETMAYAEGLSTPYPATKILAEKAVLEANGKNDLLTCALRPHLIWGKGDPHIMPRLVSKAKNGRLKVIGEGKNKVDITHVLNAANVHVLALNALMKGCACGKAYFISDDSPVELWPWINNVMVQLGVQPPTHHVSVSSAMFAAKLLEYFHLAFGLKSEPALTRFAVSELSRNHWFDITAAKRDLSYFNIVNFDLAIEEMVVNLKPSLHAKYRYAT